MKPGGWFIWNEAAYPFLVRQHDEFVETGRRFYPSQMRRLVGQSGFEVGRGAHLLGWGFGIAAALSLLYRLRNRSSNQSQPAADAHSPEDRPMNEMLNAALCQLTYLEWRLSSTFLSIPFGVSYLLAGRKPLGASDHCERLAA